MSRNSATTCAPATRMSGGLLEVVVIAAARKLIRALLRCRDEWVTFISKVIALATQADAAGLSRAGNSCL